MMSNFKNVLPCNNIPMRFYAHTAPVTRSIQTSCAGLLLLFLLLPAPAFAQDINTVFYVYSTVEKVDERRLSTEDEAEWRIMQDDVSPDTKLTGNQPVLILLGARREGRSGIAYIGGRQLPVSLVSGTPERLRGRRHSLLLVDESARRLTFVNGDVRRVLDPEISLDFPRDRLVELVLTSDRRFMIDSSRGLRIPVSPVLRR